MTSTRLVQLTRETACSVGEIGGKAAGLVAAMKAGLPVPESWVITRSDDEALPSDVLPLIEALLSRAPLGLAVRSSAVYEDSPQASFAGVFESVNGVRTVEDALTAVRTCRDSANSSAALR